MSKSLVRRRRPEKPKARRSKPAPVLSGRKIPPLANPLPKLPVAFIAGGKVNRIKLVDDPRQGFCNAYNSLGMEDRAVPIVFDADVEARFLVVLLDLSGNHHPEFVYATPHREAAKAWFSCWNQEPLGLAAAIVDVASLIGEKGGAQ